MPKRGAYALIPIWVPLLAAATPAAIVFYRDRRRTRPGSVSAAFFAALVVFPGVLIVGWWLLTRSGFGPLHLGLAFLVALFVSHRVYRQIIPPLKATGAPKCTTCDYNLTGNTSGRCPECGQAI